MGSASEFGLDLRLFLMAYPWRRIDPIPWAPLKKPLSQCRVALISSAALVLPGQAPFDPDARGGDSSFREIPGDVDVQTLVDTHPSTHFDHSGIAADRNLAFPIDRMRELAQRGRIGEVSPINMTVCGAITAPGRLIRETAPAAARRLAEAGVDAALLVPV